MPGHGCHHIIWDWNGTLLDDVDLSVAVMNDLLRPRGLPLLDRNRHQEVFGFPVRDYYTRLGLNGEAGWFESLSAEFIRGYEAGRLTCRLYPAAEAVLAAVVQSGRTQSILSAYPQDTLCEIVQHFGLAARFTRLTGLDNIYAHSKVELGRSCLRELGLPAGQVLLVGDTLHDLEVATELGLDCVLVTHGHHPPARLRDRARHMVPDLPALARWLGLPWAEATAPAVTGRPAGTAD